MTEQFAKQSDLERVEKTVANLAESVSKLSESQAATNASIKSLASFVENNAKSSKEKDNKIEDALDTIQAKPSGISLPQALMATVAIIGSLSALVGIVAGVGTLAVWTSTNISRNVAAEADYEIKQELVEIDKQNTVFEERAFHVDEKINSLFSNAEREDVRNQQQDVDIAEIKQYLEVNP